MTGLFRRLRARFRYRHFNAELKNELDVHRAMVEDELRASGETPDDARRGAARQLGNMTLARESARGIWLAPWLESVWQDVRYGVRSLRHSPGFAATALLTLTLGVGVNTTLFSLTNALLLQPWPVPDAHEVVLAYHRMSRSSGEMLVGVSAPELAFLQRAESVEMAGTRSVGGPLMAGDASRSAGGRLVSGNYFDVLRVPVVLGRGIQPGDDRPGQASVIVIGHALWTSFFASDPDVVGRTIGFNKVPVTVIGVAGPGMKESPFAGSQDVWLPLSSMPALFPDDAFAREFMTNAGHCCVDLVGRLRPGSSRAQAEAELSTLDRQFRDGDEDNALGMRVTGTEMAYAPEAGRILPVFALLFTGVAIVLLLTCANVGNLQLARAMARRREVTVRLALGAARRRVVRQLLTEGLVLSVAATSLCLVVSSLVARVVMTRIDASVARALDFSIDTRMLLFAAALTAITCLVTSLPPALRGTRHLVAGRTSDRPGLRMRSTFLAVQVAASVVLLIAAILLGRGLAQAASQDVGFRLDTLMAMRVDRPPQGSDGGRVFLHDVASAIGSRPVAIAAVMPLGDTSFHTDVRRSGESDDASRQTRFQPVSSTYFDVLGIPLRSGRTFSDTASDEVVLNDTLARMLWPDGDAVGGHLGGPNGTIGRQVVGVVADAHLNGLGPVGPVIFQPASQATYLLFNDGEVAPDELRAVVAGVDPAATTTVQAVGDNVGDSLEAATAGAGVAAGLGVLALAIAAVGIAGVFSFAVTERTREIGIRLALGSSRGGVRTLLLRRSSTPIVAGVLSGLVLAFAAGPALRSYLYGLGSSDPLTYLGVVAVVVFTAWTAMILPLRRALRIDPAIALRHE